MGHEELLNFCRGYNKIICYGAGKYAMVVREYLYEHDIELEKFVVTQNKHNKSSFMGKSIEEISEIQLDSHDVGIIIAAGETKHEEMKATLQQYGITEYFPITKKCYMDIDCHTNYEKTWYNHRKNICVLLYHRVSVLPLDVWGLAISPESFEKHVKFYKENYKILRFDEDWSDVEEPSLVITFDDGYADNFQYALPVLEKYQVPATVFVSTGNIGTDKEFWWDELERILFYCDKREYYFQYDDEQFRLETYKEKEEACRKIRLFLKKLLPQEREKLLISMAEELSADKTPREYNRSLKEEELVKLAASPFITIGGHTVTHNMLSVESKEQQEWEILESKSKIEGIIDRELEVFSYPFGGNDDINKNSIESVRKAGYKKAATTVVGLAGRETEPFVIPRNGMPFYDENRAIKKELKKIYTLL